MPAKRSKESRSVSSSTPRSPPARFTGPCSRARRPSERCSALTGVTVALFFWFISSLRILPVRREILLGVLYSDLLGFHTYDYARHFLSSCTRILSFPTMPNGVEFEGRLAHVGT